MVVIAGSIRLATQPQRPPFLAWARRMGLMTYPLYLIHTLVGSVAIAALIRGGASGALALALAMSLSVALAFVVSDTRSPRCAGRLPLVSLAAGRVRPQLRQPSPSSCPKRPRRGANSSSTLWGSGVNVQFIGFVTLLVGLIGLVKGPPFDIWAFLISLLFGAAAGVIFESLGSVNILPAHIMLGFLALGLVLRRGGLAQGLRTLAPGSAGFWFLWMVAYGVVSAFFMPRLFAGATDVFTVARGTSGPGLFRARSAPYPGMSRRRST